MSTFLLLDLQIPQSSYLGYTNAKTRANLLLCIKDDQLIHVISFKTSQKFEDQVIIHFKTTNIVDKIVSQEKSIH
jgi:hypothetical protein